MSGSTWPSLVAGARAKASEVEAKFDWLEGALVPMSGGTKADNTYDLGESAFRWKNAYMGPGSAATPALCIRSNDMGIYSASVSTLNFAVSGTSVGFFNNRGGLFLPNQPGFMAYQVTTGFSVTASGSFAFNTKAIDRGNVFTTTTNAFIAPEDGLYCLGFSVNVYAQTTTGLLQVDFRFTTTPSFRSGIQFSGTEATITTTSLIYLSRCIFHSMTAGMTCTVVNANSSRGWTYNASPTGETMFFGFKVS